jgi:hypothetical protein
MDSPIPPAWHHLVLGDAAAQPALYQHHPRQEAHHRPDPAERSPRPSAPAERDAATPHAPTGSTRPGTAANANTPAAGKSPPYGSQGRPVAHPAQPHDGANRSQPDDQPTVRLGGPRPRGPVLTASQLSARAKAADGDLRQASRHGPHNGLRDLLAGPGPSGSTGTSHAYVWRRVAGWIRRSGQPGEDRAEYPADGTSARGGRLR